MEEDKGKGSGKVVQDKDQSHCKSSVEIAKDVHKIQNMMGSMTTMVKDLSIRVQVIGDFWQNFKIDRTNGATFPPEDNSLEDLPPFPEKFDVVVFRDWVERIEKYFVKHHIREHTKVELVASTLKGEAIDWWAEIEELNKKVDKRAKQFSWVDMKKLFMVHYLLSTD